MTVTLYRAGAITMREELGHEDGHMLDSMTALKDSRVGSVYASARSSDANDWAEWRERQGLDSCKFKIVVPSMFDDEVRAYSLEAYDEWWAFPNKERAARYAASAVQVNSMGRGFCWNHEVLLPYDVALESEWYALSCDEDCEHNGVFEATGGSLSGRALLELVTA